NGQTQPHFSTIQALAKALSCSSEELQSAIRPAFSSDDAIGQFAGDWPFLTDLDPDLRKGLITSLVAEWTHSSTALEGNTITLGDTLFVLTEGLTVSGKSLREHQELHGHSAALGLMVSWTQSGRSAGISELHELHRAIQTGVAIDSLAPVGRWKVEPNGTTAITTNGESSWHDYAHPRHVSLLAKDFLKTLNTLPKSVSKSVPKFSRLDASLVSRSQDLITLYTAVHLAFVAIHPYADGNGRMARLLANLPLLKAGYPPILIDASERRRYLSLLGDYSLSRGQPKPGEELVIENSEHLAVEDFFRSCWGKSLQLIEGFHEKQGARE
ncbi:MAG: Fic family protein, partial [Bacteroidota bacterium]